MLWLLLSWFVVGLIVAISFGFTAHHVNQLTERATAPGHATKSRHVPSNEDSAVA